MKYPALNRLTVIAVIITLVVLGLLLFIKKGNSGLHENLRMNRVARILEGDEMITHTYGPNCKIRRLESGLQAVVVLDMELHHESCFELTTPSEVKYINVKWSSGGRGLDVKVYSFIELPKS